MSNNLDVEEFKNLLIKKLCEIGYLKNEITEKSLEISKLENLVNDLINEKLNILPNDEIKTQLDKIYQKNLNRSIDFEGLLLFYPQIKTGTLSYTDLEKQIQTSSEFKLLQKQIQT